VLASQFTQELSDEAPAVVRYLPAPQSTQALATVAPVVVRYLPALQSRHMEAPVIILYFPAAHAAHDTPLSPTYPRLQRQLLERLLPLRDCEFTGQSSQVEDAVAPTASE
jgi:hypothetical protein